MGDTQLAQQTDNPWDLEADTFDEAPDHGLRDAAVRERWIAVLEGFLPATGSSLDVGCGTGTLSVLMAERGLDVTGIDSAPRMLEVARRKAESRGVRIRFALGDVTDPDVPPASLDVVLCRHVLWALPEPSTALANWSRLLRKGGRLVLIEGFWHTGVGLHASDVEAALPRSVRLLSTQDLGSDPILWGGPVSDERFMVVAEHAP